MLRTAGLFATLALIVSACSQAPADVAAPTLEAQFGTADDDYGADVVTAPAGGAYALSGQSGDLENGLYDKVLLRRFDTSGKTLWTREVSSYACDYDRDYECGNEFRFAVTLGADAKGNAYVLDGFRYILGDAYYKRDYTITKVDLSGKTLGTFRVGATATGFGAGEGEQEFLSVAVDKDGNVYVAKTQFDYDSYDPDINTTTNVVAKYSTNGGLLWQRPSTVGVPKGVAVSSTGNVFVVGSTGLSKYAPSGTLLWTKAGAGEDVTVSGSYVYVRQGETLRKYDGNGKQLWSKAQTGLSSPVFADLSGDGGNVYLAGNVATAGGGRDAFTRKISSSGSVLWTKLFGTGANDYVGGVSTVTGNEVYVTGSTQGSLAHTNYGGSDGFLRKMDANGNRIWTR